MNSIVYRVQCRHCNKGLFSCYCEEMEEAKDDIEGYGDAYVNACDRHNPSSNLIDSHASTLEEPKDHGYPTWRHGFIRRGTMEYVMEHIIGLHIDEHIKLLRVEVSGLVILDNKQGVYKPENVVSVLELNPIGEV